MYDHEKHHRRHRHLKRTLVLTIIGGVLLVGSLYATIATISENINRNSSSNQSSVEADVEEILKEPKAFTLPDNTSNVPETLDPATLIDVVAKNQPAVVRILTITCSDITLTHNGNQLRAPDTCAAGVGSGSIISSDGYIATNGHVAVITERQAFSSTLTSIRAIDDYVSFLVRSELIESRDAPRLLDGSSEAQALLESTVSQLPVDSVRSLNSETIYAVQLGNEPVRIVSTGDRIGVEFTDTIYAGLLVAKNYDPESSAEALYTGEFRSSDIAILKVDGTFPTVRLGSIDNVESGDTLTAIGFPAFIDDSVNTDKWQTVPSITQGTVIGIERDAQINGRNIIETSVQIAQGSSGGPAFNSKGEQIGLNTYSDLECEDLQCFGDGVIRDIADLKVLLDEQDIVIREGTISKDWHEGLDAYQSGNYRDALRLFQSVQDQYPAHYLAAPMARLAREQVGSQTDTSSAFEVRNVIGTVVTILVVVVLCIAGTVAYLIFHFSRQHKKAMKS